MKKEEWTINCFKKKLITDLGTILADSQHDLTKIDPNAYQPIFTCKKKED